MKVSTQMIEETFLEMHKYGAEHFGVPNGPDYPDIAKALAESEKAMMSVLISAFLIGMSGKEMAASMPKEGDVPAGQRMKKTLEAVSKSTVFQPFAEMLYLGYLLGKRSHEIENLERTL